MTPAGDMRDTDIIVPSQQSKPERKTFAYVISGLLVHSEIELPSAIPSEPRFCEPDVTIVEREIPELLDGAECFGGTLLQIAGTRIRYTFSNIMDVLVEDGRRITLQRAPNAMQGDVVMFLLGTTFALILQQRGRIVVHASAVAVGDKAMLFCGPSGAGKSTMAALLSRRGYPLLNDDVCNLSRTSDGAYTVFPDGRMLKLWSQSLDHLKVRPNEEQRIRTDAEKFYMAPESVDLTPRVVGGVYCLSQLDGPAGPSLEKLSVAEAMIELTVNAYRPGLVKAMKMQAEYFQASASITAKSGVYRLSRVKDFSRVDEVLDLLETSWTATAEKCGA